jgi:hypothetical protein
MTYMQLSRRDLILQLAKGAVGAGALVLGGQDDVGLEVFGARALPGPSRGGGSLPRLSAVGTTTSHGGAQVFRSRPDLHPPVVTVDVAGHDLTPGLVFTDAHAGPSHQGPMIISTQGDLVWFLDVSPGSDTALRVFNFRAQSLLGKPVLTWFQGAVISGHGQGHYELWDTSYTKVAEVAGKNGYRADLHEFVLTTEGTALFTCYGQAPVDLRPYGGPKDGSYFYGVVQEVDVRTGKLLLQWRSNDHVALEESYQQVTHDTATWDYFHVNSIGVDPIDGNLIISGRNTWTVYKVDRTTGKMLWRLGGKKSNFKVASDAEFAFQHDVRRYPDGSLSMFDNEGGPPAEAAQSRGLLLSVDEKSGQAGLRRAYYHSPPVLSDSLGSVQELGDGGIFMGWGESSYFTQYSANGKVLLDGHLSEHTESYRAFREDWAGRPTAELPALAVEDGGSTATLYASYNGCTDLARWVVLGGRAHDRLTPIGYAESRGFETAITIRNPPAYLAAQAVARTGEVLASAVPQHVG